MGDMRTSCGAVIFREQGTQTLLIQYYDGHWSFPKGRMEPGETERETALREVQEETGLTVRLRQDFRAETVSVKRSTGAKTVFFLGTPVSGREQVQKTELAAQKWFSVQEAMERVTYAGDRAVLQKAADAFAFGRKKSRHLLICGAVGVGKSTLIARLLEHSSRPLYGFATKRIPTPDEDGLCSVYLHPAAQRAEDRTYGVTNRVGRCDGRRAIRCPQVFDTLGVALLRAPENGLILMDELGFLENDAAKFRAAVLRTLDGETPVLAAVKSRDTDFLRAVKAHPNAELAEITPENRNALYRQLLPKILEWND